MAQASETLNSALKRAAKLTSTAGMAKEVSDAAKARRKAAQQLNELTQAWAVPPSLLVPASSHTHARTAPAHAHARGQVGTERVSAVLCADAPVRPDTQTLAVPLGTYTRGFPKTTRLHPFERALLDLTVGTAHYEKTLFKVDVLRKATLEVGKGLTACAPASPLPFHFRKARAHPPRRTW